MKKRLMAIAVILTLIMATGLVLAACGGDEKPAEGTPSAPKSFTAGTTTATSVSVSWAAPDNKGDSDITKYEVQKQGDSTWIDKGTALSHEFTGLTANTNYTFRVRAVNTQGAGAVAEVSKKTEAGQSSGGDSFNDWDYVLARLPAEFSITYRIPCMDNDCDDDVHPNHTIRVARTANGYFFEQDGETEYGSLLIKSGNNYVDYYYDDSEGMYVVNTGYPNISQEGINLRLLLSVGIYMVPWAEATGVIKGGSVTVAGRACDNYTYSPMAGITYTLAIDRETGACLKMTGGMDLECIEFKTTGVTLPRYEGDGGAAIHVHNFDSYWSSDSTGHWYACSGCDEKKDFAPHTGNPCTACYYDDGSDNFAYGADFMKANLPANYKAVYETEIMGMTFTKTIIRTAEGLYMSTDMGFGAIEFLWVKNASNTYDEYMAFGGEFMKLDDTLTLDELNDEAVDFFVGIYGKSAESQMKKSGTDTFLSRNCDKYSYSNRTFWFDTATGVCLKYTEGSGYTEECKEFKINGNTLPDHTA